MAVIKQNYLCVDLQTRTQSTPMETGEGRLGVCTSGVVHTEPESVQRHNPQCPQGQTRTLSGTFPSHAAHKTDEPETYCEYHFHGVTNR